MDGPQEVEFTRLLFLGISVMFLLALAIIVFIVLYQRKLFRQQIRLKQIEADHQMSLMAASLHAQEKERNRIASDLHDEVGATLSAAKLYSSQIREGNPSAERREVLARQVDDIMDEAIKRVRQISHNLLPPTLEKLGLNSALSDLAGQINVASDVQVSVEYHLEKRLPMHVELNIYRIMQELVNNTLKHANAETAVISVVQSGKLIDVKYADDGIGFDIDQQNGKSDGLGLNSVKSRGHLLGANPTLTSAPEKGTTFSITFSETQHLQ